MTLEQVHYSGQIGSIRNTGFTQYFGESQHSYFTYVHNRGVLLICKLFIMDNNKGLRRRNESYYLRFDQKSRKKGVKMNMK